MSNAPDAPDSSADRDPLDRLAEEFVARLRAGARPSIDEYAERHPDRAAEIRDLFPALAELESLKPATGDRTGDFPAAVQPSDPVRVGEFRVLRRVGVGGMGVVYEAIQESLGRHVALKLLPPDALLDAKRLERFRREARAAAGLHHTNIVPVFGTGEVDGRHFYAMQFIAGHPLDAIIDEVRRLKAKAAPAAPRAVSEVAAALVTGSFVGPPVDSAALAPTRADGGATPPAPDPTAAHPPSGLSGSASEGGSGYWVTCARLAAQVADALAYAHGQGVLHRDIKPANLLLDLRGTVWVTDFGLAKATDADNLTQAGDIVGTLRYMAPERFDGTGDARADVYALGLTLYELLTLHPAFEASNKAKLVEQALAASPPRPRAHNPAIPRDLETVVLKCIARDPALRYQTAADLAADLRRYVEDRPILARRASSAERALRWCRRNPAVASLMAAVLVVFAAGAAVSAYYAVQADARETDARDSADEAKRRANDATAAGRAAADARRAARRNEAEALVGEAHGIRYSRREGQRFAALAALKKAADIGRELDLPPDWFHRLRNEAAAALALPDMHAEREWEGKPDGTAFLTAAADHSVYARVDKTGAVSVRRVGDDTELLAVPADGRTMGCVWLSDDGRHLCVHRHLPDGSDRLSAVWRLDPGGAAEVVRERDVHWMAFVNRPEGRWAAFVRMDGSLTVFDVTGGKRLAEHPTVGGTNWVLHPHPREPLAALASYSHREVVVRNVRTGAVVAVVTPPWAGGSAAAWHPGGFLLVGAADLGEMRIYDFDAKTGRLQYQRSITVGQGDPRITFNRAGDRFYASGWGAGVTLHDFWTGRELFRTKLTLHGPMAVDVDRARVALGVVPERPTRVGVWAAAEGREYRPIVPASEFGKKSCYGVAVHPGGRLLAQGAVDGVCLYDLETGRELAALRVPGRGEAVMPHFDASGNLYTNGYDGCYRWPVRPDPTDPGRLVVGPPDRIPFHPGNRFVSASRDGRVVAQVMYAGYGMQNYAGGWLIHPDHPQPRLVAGGSMHHASVSPDGRWVAFSTGDATVHDAASGREVARFPSAGMCTFSADGRLLLLGGTTSRVVAVGTWEPVADLGAGAAYDITTDGRHAILSLPAGIYRLVDVASGRELVRLEDPEAHPGQVWFAPDGARVVTQAPNGMRIWDLRRIRAELAVLGLDWDAPPYPPGAPVADRFEVRIEVSTATPTPSPPAAKPKPQPSPLEVAALHLAADPWAADARLALAHETFRAGRYEEARAHFTLAALGSREPGEALAWRGHSSFERDRWREAINDYDEALRFSPHFSGTQIDRARAYQRLGRHAEAVADLSAVLKLPDRRKDPWLWHLRSVSLAASGRRAEAELDAAVAKALVTADVAKDLNGRAWARVVRPTTPRAHDMAEDVARLAVGAEPRNPLYLNTLGVALYRTGKHAEAAAVLYAGWVLDRGTSAAFDLYPLAMCHGELGDAKKAKEFFARAAAWHEAKGATLSAGHAAELTTLRAEAAARLGLLAPPPRPVTPAP